MNFNLFRDWYHNFMYRHFRSYRVRMTQDRLHRLCRLDSRE